MKIACITDDGKTISQHFGRAPYYAVLTVADGAITGRELRSKMGHQHFAATESGEAAGVHHGQDAASHDKHVSMAEAIADCEVLLCRGMGQGAYQSMLRVGIKPMVTDITDIEQAVLAYVAGRLVDHTELLH
ncbi:MAG: dinitrogenase iron-molybdenum cofactor biosynthesis protein [Chloroflexi bacterium]|nr:dinitrogenase iron-molybdenum cofactor biosynthesis protein [Chloroflexota bacterium]